MVNLSQFPKGDIKVKIIIYLIGGLLILSGAIWFLQGINILPGSFMTGDPQWSINGAITIVIGSGLIYLARRRK
jgi:hypothetical protein